MTHGPRTNSSGARDANEATRARTRRLRGDDVSRPPVVRRAANTVRFVVTIAAVAALIVGLVTIDLLLVTAHHGGADRYAAAEYRTGMSLLAGGRVAEAAEHFSAALRIERDNIRYALALGEAQWRAGNLVDAEATLKNVLERAGDDGVANLAIARLMARQHRVAEAKGYFHRAIFGRWDDDSLARQRQARLELIALLAANGGGRDLLAELLPFEDVSPDSLALRRRLGQWFLLAGSPARAARMFGEVLVRDPRDAVSYAGMGEATLAQGDFTAARANFVRASAIEPRDASVARRLALADSLVALDPTARGLDAAERRSRGVALVERTLTALDACVPRDSVALADSARVILAGQDAVDGDASKAERLLTMANGLWSAYGSSCADHGEDEALRLLYERLAS
jgi:Tfp pilus assembly protein PilF